MCLSQCCPLHLHLISVRWERAVSGMLLSVWVMTVAVEWWCGGGREGISLENIVSVFNIPLQSLTWPVRSIHVPPRIMMMMITVHMSNLPPATRYTPPSPHTWGHTRPLNFLSTSGPDAGLIQYSKQKELLHSCNIFLVVYALKDQQSKYWPSSCYNMLGDLKFWKFMDCN